MTLNRKNKRTDIDITAKTLNTIDKSGGVSGMSILEIRVAYHAEQMFSVCRSCSMWVRGVVERSNIMEECYLNMPTLRFGKKDLDNPKTYDPWGDS